MKRCLLSMLVLCALSAPSFAAPALSTLFYQAADAFHRAEPRFHIYDNPRLALSPLPKGDPQIAAYQNAARAAERFLAAQTKPSQGTPIMLYFAAMSYDRLGDNEKTLLYLNRLLNEFPDYKRPRVDGHPAFDHPVKADLLHLKLWHTRQLDKTPETIESLRQLAQDATQIAVLRDEQDRIAQNYPDLDTVAPTADMRRTSALPSPVQLALEVHDAALPEIAKAKGAKAVRDYLRSLNQRPLAAYFADYAGKKLVDLDKVILAGYRSDANKALKENRFAAAIAIYQRMLDDYAGSPIEEEAAAGLRKAQIGGYRFAATEAFKANDFDKAKANWRKIVAEFAGSPEAIAADAELQKIVSVAVKFYQTEADKNFKPGRQIGIPQTKAGEYYEKMYREEPDGAQADYAYLHWNRALGTENKIEQAMAQLAQMEKKFPDSELRAQAIYSRAFLAASPKLRRYDEAVGLLQKLVKDFPASPQAPEALWHIAFWSAPTGRYAQAIAALEDLQKRYPESRRAKFVPKQIEQLRAKMTAGNG